jgi:hypothetical protein
MSVSMYSLPVLEDAVYTSTSSSGVIGALIHEPKQRALEQS